MMVYEGSATFERDLEVGSGAGHGVVEVEIQYMACTEEYCLPPARVTKSVRLDGAPAARGSRASGARRQQVLRKEQ